MVVGRGILDAPRPMIGDDDGWNPAATRIVAVAGQRAAAAVAVVVRPPGLVLSRT